MDTLGHCEVSFRMNGKKFEGKLRLEKDDRHHVGHMRAVIENTPLNGTYGGFAESKELALDFLNLAMQAEGAEEVAISCPKAA